MPLGFIFHFGKWIFLSTILAFLVGQSDRLIFGKIVPLATLGVYSIAAMFAALPTGVLHRVGSAVVFPAFSRKAESMNGFASAYRRSRRPLSSPSEVWVVACLAASGPALIETLYDPRYADAGWILQLLAIGAWFHILQVPSGSALLALGLPRWLAVAQRLQARGDPRLRPARILAVRLPRRDRRLRRVRDTPVRGPCRGGTSTRSFPRRGATSSCRRWSRWPRRCGLYAGLAIGQSGGGSLERLAGSVLAASLAWLPVFYVLLRREAVRLAADLGFSLRWLR